MIAEAFGVDNECHVEDLDNQKLWEEHDQGFDLVFALSAMNWAKDKNDYWHSWRNISKSYMKAMIAFKLKMACDRP